MKTKDWQLLSLADFEIKNPEWIPSLQAMVLVNGAEVTLLFDESIDDAPKADETAVTQFIDLLRGWLKRLPEIASETETYLQTFLPGRKISSDELALWGLTLCTRAGKASAGTFHFNVTGEYDNPDYALDQFDQQSVVELQYPIKNNVIDWSEGDISATNDFD